MARGREKLTIDKVVLQRHIDELEKTQNFANIGELWNSLAQTEWAKNMQPRPLTAQVAYMRAKELGIVTKTLPGKRGGTMTPERIANMQAGRGEKRPRKEKMAKFRQTFADIKKEYPPQFLPLIKRAENGSIKAAIRLKCLDCSGFQRAEITNCTCIGCSLYPFR